MTKPNCLPGSFAVLGFIVLILDGKTALYGMQTGIELCFRTVIPVLFPFILLSILLTTTLSGTSLPFLRPLVAVLGIPKGAESILISGFLGGYPVGAQAVSEAYATGHLTRQDSEHMLSFCSNAGPAFLFGMAGSMFSEPSAAFGLWMIHWGSAMLVALTQPVTPLSTFTPSPAKPLTISDAMFRGMKVMAGICGWVITFRLFLAFLERWFFCFIPDTFQTILTGILELSNGCLELSCIPDPKLRFVICSGMLAWGGLCVVLQTKSVIRDLSILPYLKGKLLQTLLSILISAALVLKIFVPVTGLLLFLLIILRKTQKSSGNPAAAGV